MQKRGYIVLKSLGILIISTMIVLAFLQAGKSYGKGEVYYKAAVAEDLALILTQLSSLPGDTLIIYPQKLEKFTITTKKTGVLGETLIEVSLSQYGPADFTVGKSSVQGIEVAETSIKSPSQLAIQKTGNAIRIYERKIT